VVSIVHQTLFRKATYSIIKHHGGTENKEKNRVSILQNEAGNEKTVINVFSDDNKKYLSTDYSSHEQARAGFLSSDVELIKKTASLLRRFFL